MARAKKSVSDNVVLAQSRNRSAEHSLKRAVRRLNDQEQLIHDRHQREVLQWRDFRRQSVKTSGTWCTSFEEEFGEDWSASEENLDTPRDKRDSENSSGASSRNSPRLNSRRGSSAGTPNDLARPLPFQSDALIKLQQPWAYTYSMTSYNSLYKESMQLAEGQKKRLNFRRASDSPRSTSPPVYMKMFRSRSTVGDVGQDLSSGSQRPLTGRSTPGIPLRIKSSRHRLSPSASVEMTRPRTSVGLVRGAKSEYKELHEQKTNDCAIQHGPENNPKAENCDMGLQFQQNSEDDNVDIGDVLDSLLARMGEASDSASRNSVQSGSALPVSDPKPLSPGETAEIETATDPHRTKLHLSVLGARLEAHLNGGPPLTSETGDDTCPHQQEGVECVNKEETPCPVNADNTRTDQLASLADTPERQVREKKVHIQLTGKAPKVDTQSNQVDSKIVQDQNCAKHAMPSADSSKRDENVPPPTKTETPCPSPPTPHRPQIRADCREDNRLKSTSQDCSGTRRSSDVGVLRQRSDMTSHFPRSGRRNSGALSRRYSAIDLSGPSSFMKIADQLEALREFTQQRMIPIDDEGEEDWAEEDSCGSPNQANTSVTPLTWQQPPGQETGTQPRSGAKSLRETGTVSGKEREALPAPQPQHPPAAHVSSSPTRNQPSMTKKPSVDNASSEVAQRNSEPDSNETADFAPTPPHNGTSVSRQKSNAADITVFRGFQLHNYVRPQDRYRADALIHLRRERSMPPLSTKTAPMRASSQQETKPAVTFSRTSRQKVLQELVHRHNRPVKAADTGVMPPQLRSRIDQFLKTIEPYCPKPDVVLE